MREIFLTFHSASFNIIIKICNYLVIFKQERKLIEFRKIDSAKYLSHLTSLDSVVNRNMFNLVINAAETILMMDIKPKVLFWF